MGRRNRSARSTTGVARAIIIIVFVAAHMPACGSGERPLADVDPNAAPQHPTFAQVNTIIQRECTPCHDGKESPPLATCEEITEEIDVAYAEIIGNTMPPGAWPRLSETEKLIIERWIGDGAPAPCD
jgi:uncharacterized membrane protein